MPKHAPFGVEAGGDAPRELDWAVRIAARHDTERSVLRMPDRPTRHDGNDTPPRCTRLYGNRAGRRAQCDGPMAPIRRPGMWGCEWCGKVEVTR